jgi:uncharacterized repeat protein (TIGR01451 family)
LTLTWTALFVCSLLLQYLSFASAPPVLAVHNEGVFELEGDATSGAAPGDDWDKIFNGTSGASATVFQTDTANRRFTGGSKDTLDVDEWAWDSQSSPDKDDILHAYAGQYENGGDEITVFGLDRFANNGDANVGFWFFQQPIGVNADGTFSGQHVNGDVFIVSEFDSGGQVSTIVLYKWLNGGLSQVVSGIECGGAGDDDICAIANSGDVSSPWPYTPKQGSAGTFPVASFFEGGADMGAIFGTALPCFSTFLAETRSSTSTTAELKNFLLGSFNTCVPPTITTQRSSATVDFGGTVTDTATLSGNDGPASGNVTFFICTPAQVTAAGCPTGSGSQLGSPVAVSTTANGGTATSSAYTVGLTAAAVGKYCFRAEYSPDQASQYLAGSHTDATLECFTVAPATIDIVKVANPAGPVSAGDSIGFDITVTNTGTGTALNVAVNDPLPPGVDWTLGAVSGGATCGITGPVGTEVLACTKASLAAAASFSAHISGTTDPADCGTISNTASVTTSNDGSDQATASVVVQCPDVTVVKTPDGGDVNAGGIATFTIVVSNLGPGIARNVTLTDNLPAGIDWTEDSTSCSISGAVGAEVLSCNFGDMASGASATVNVSGLTDAQDCGNIPNTATVGATNERAAQAGNNSDSGSIDVLCADITILKEANPVGPVSAGDTIGWDITISNIGDGIATDVHVSDSLPAGVDWVLGAITGDTTGVTCQITGSVGSEGLTCDDASMAAGDSFTVHVSGATDAADCGTINNTASVTTGNDGSGSSQASIVVNCPDLEVVKSGNGPLNAGDTATFTIILTNHGPGAAHDVTLSDQLPAGSWTLGGTDAADCSIDGSNLLTCDFGDVASGASRTITVSTTTDADDCGTIHNEVTVGASNEPENDQFPNSDDADIVVNCPDLEVVKTGNGPLSAGEVATFTITVTNHGPGTAYDVTLTDQLPAGSWTLGGANAADCSINGTNLLTCDFGDLADDASRTITVSKTTDPADCGTIHNDVTVGASNEPQDDQFPNSDDADIVVNCPDVTVFKTGNGTISAGEVATFDITVTNLGPGTAFDVTLSDQLPAGSWTLGGADAEDCSIDGTNLLTCDFGDLAADASRTITLSRETVAADCGEIPNTATVSASNEAEEDTDNNESSARITVDCPLIVITKTADDPIVDAGDQIGFVITVTNTGDGSAFDVTVTDVLPIVAGVSWSIESQSGGWSIVGGTLQFGPATLGAGASATVHIVSDTSADSCGDIPNLASVTFDGGSGSDDSEVSVLCAEIGISKVADDDTVSAGDQIGFTVTLSNEGEGAANGLAFTDSLPGGPGIDWSIDPASAGWSITGTAPNQVLVYEPTSLAGGATTVVHVVSDTSAASCGVYDNTASVTTVNDGSDEASDSVTLNCPDIAVEKTATNTPIPVGEDLVFDITVSNIGDGTAFDVVLVDVLPAGFAWSVDNEDCAIEDGTLTCELGDLAPDDGVTVTITAPTVDEGPGSADCGTIDNTAVASAINESQELLENNSDDASIVVECPTPSTLTIEKAVTGNTGGTDPILDVPLAKIGDTLTYTLDYAGTGPITNAIITDVLPVGLDYVEGSAEGDANFTFVDYDDATRTLTWTAASLPDPASGSVSYDVVVLEEAAEEVQPLVNVATIDSDETEPDDDTRSVAVLPPVLVLTPPPTSTLTPETGTSNPGFTLMLVLLAIAGLALGVGFVTPVPERVRRRDRLG